MRCLWPCQGKGLGRSDRTLALGSAARLSIKSELPHECPWCYAASPPLPAAQPSAAVGPLRGHPHGRCLSLPPGEDVGSLCSLSFRQLLGERHRPPEPELQPLLSGGAHPSAFNGGSAAPHDCWPRARRLSGCRVSCRLPAGLRGEGGESWLGKPPGPPPAAAERAFPELFASATAARPSYPGSR